MLQMTKYCQWSIHDKVLQQMFHDQRIVVVKTLNGRFDILPSTFKILEKKQSDKGFVTWNLIWFHITQRTVITVLNTTESPNCMYTTWCFKTPTHPHTHTQAHTQSPTQIRTKIIYTWNSWKIEWSWSFSWMKLMCLFKCFSLSYTLCPSYWKSWFGKTSSRKRSWNVVWMCSLKSWLQRQHWNQIACEQWKVPAL